MILRRDLAAALAFWLLVAGLVWLRVEIGPVHPPAPSAAAEGPASTTAALGASPGPAERRLLLSPDGR